MTVTSFVLACFLGVSMGYLSYFVLAVYHLSIHNGLPSRLNKRPVILGILLACFVSTVIFTILLENLVLLAMGLLVNSLLCAAALTDVYLGRVPRALLGFAALFSLMPGFVSKNVGYRGIGGAGMIFITWGIYWILKNYNRKARGTSPAPPFGGGDIHCAGILGFIFGFPLGITTFIVGLVFAVVFAGLRSLLDGGPFLRRRLRLGIFFYASSLMMVGILLWGSL